MSAESLVDWLSARLDEDEQRACAAAPGGWTTYVYPEGVPMSNVLYSDSGRVIGEVPGEETIAHIARWDPARVLAEVAAKRRIIEHVSSWQHDDPDSGGYYSCPLVPGSSRAEDEDWDGTSCWCGVVARQMAILGPLALPYAGRDGWREEWRPQ